MKEEPRDAVATDNAVMEEKEPEEGGLRAWLTVVGSALVYFASFGFMNSFGYFQDFYQDDYLADYSSSTIAFIGTLQISLMYVVGPVAGALFDAYGLKVNHPLQTTRPLNPLLIEIVALSCGSSRLLRFPHRAFIFETRGHMATISLTGKIRWYWRMNSIF